MVKVAGDGSGQLQQKLVHHHDDDDWRRLATTIARAVCVRVCVGCRQSVHGEGGGRTTPAEASTSTRRG